MKKNFSKYVVGGALLATVFIDNAYAIPSFARQTGFECTVCHTVFPELTQTGREFKLRGYTLSNGEKKSLFSPLSAMVMADITDNAHNDNGNDVIAKNGAITIPQISLFYGGKITDKSGAFIQVTDTPSNYPNQFLPRSHDLGNGNVHIDNMDIRYADSFTLADKELIYGVSVNNNPSMSDLWNSTPAWTFPYAQTGMSHTPTTGGAQVDGSLGQSVGGVGAYAMWNDLLYAELSLYRSAKPGGIMGLFGWKNQALKGDVPLVQGTTPYARVALQQNFGDHYVMVGGYMMNTKINQAAYSNAGGPLDQYKDHAIDAEYQYTNGSHIVTATATKIWEKQTLDYSALSGANPSNTLSTTRARVSYYFDQKYGASVGIFSTAGTSDMVLYSTNTNFSPNSSGKGAELDYLPLQNIKLALQYTRYDTFNGASTYVGTTDGLMHKASENNNFYLLAWFMF